MTSRETRKWIALLGRQDKPVDGVEDYCTFLARGLQWRGVNLDLVRMRWAEIGWIRALLELRRQSSKWQGKWVFLQYTALGWSRHGFPFPLRVVVWVLHSAGARVAVTFHEPHRQVNPFGRWIDLIRGKGQDYLIRRVYRQADKVVFTVPLDAIDWLPKTDNKAIFIPIGANIPESLEHRAGPVGPDQPRTVIVFGVTGGGAMQREVEEIAAVMKGANEAVANLRLVVLGRGAADAKNLLAEALQGSNVELVVRGILPAEEIAHEFKRADALLFVRGLISLRRGSALAGVACGLPIVGYRNGDLSGPLADAGLECSPGGDRRSLVQGLIRVLSDPALWMELHQRNLTVQKNWFSWDRIAERYCAAFAE